ncbi:hypothetical protein [Fischerella sp. PCC 9605]|uniref:hypothetical protein n=1 Tax=Fischerella sp. PCC 9605 TaxID=1173024 RepID=UPI0004B307A9|nr:hypothetical protein [Fischerella sp. PCC 9605]
MQALGLQVWYFEAIVNGDRACGRGGRSLITTLHSHKLLIRISPPLPKCYNQL